MEAFHDIFLVHCSEVELCFWMSSDFPFAEGPLPIQGVKWNGGDNAPSARHSHWCCRVAGGPGCFVLSSVGPFCNCAVLISSPFTYKKKCEGPKISYIWERREYDTLDLN